MMNATEIYIPSVFVLFLPDANYSWQLEIPEEILVKSLAAETK